MKSIGIGVAVLMALVIAAFAIQPSGGEPGEKKADEPAPAAPAQEGEKKNDARAEEEFVYIQMTTSMGDIYLALNETRAPISVENFRAYTEKGYYDGTIFHRVMKDFMIQGGGFKPDMTKMPSLDPIENEWKNGLSNERGTIAMARLGGRENSATAQFFINVVDNPFLDRPNPNSPNDHAGYAVFGRVVGGMDVVDKIRNVKTGNQGPYGNVPAEPVIIEKVRQIDEARAKELGLLEEDDG